MNTAYYASLAAAHLRQRYPREEDMADLFQNFFEEEWSSKNGAGATMAPTLQPDAVILRHGPAAQQFYLWYYLNYLLPDFVHPGIPLPPLAETAEPQTDPLLTIASPEHIAMVSNNHHKTIGVIFYHPDTVSYREKLCQIIVDYEGAVSAKVTDIDQSLFGNTTVQVAVRYATCDAQKTYYVHYEKGR